MVNITKDNFDLEQICKSGQCFRMLHEGGNLYSIVARNRYLEVEQQDSQCIFHCDETEFEGFWKGYFDLDNDYSRYIASIDSADDYLVNAAAFGSGIRILRQDLWEMIVTFLISQQNNITRIRRCINNICERYGEKQLTPQGKTFYTFPGADSLAGLEEDALMECNLGYRSKYVVRTAGSVASEAVNLEELANMPYPEAREELLKLYGVGGKVADCICLFALHHLQAFPVDTHINQALTNHYQDGFPGARYEGYQGIIQQYIFYYELFNK